MAGQKTAEKQLKTDASASSEAANENVAGNFSIEVNGPPYTIMRQNLSEQVKRLEVVPASFKQHIACINEANIARARSEDDGVWRKFFNRARMKAQLRAYNPAGELIPLTEVDILMMPRAYASALSLALFRHNTSAGKVLTKGDGVTSPVLYQLGTPIKVQKGGEDKEEAKITELEFMAATYGDVEDILAASSTAEQALFLVQHCSKPISSSVNFQRLPSWALDQLTIPDGETIMEAVLPAFLSMGE